MAKHAVNFPRSLLIKKYQLRCWLNMQSIRMWNFCSYSYKFKCNLDLALIQKNFLSVSIFHFCQDFWGPSQPPYEFSTSIPFYSTPTLSAALGDIEACTEKERIPPPLGVPAYQSVQHHLERADGMRYYIIITAQIKFVFAIYL